MERSTLTPNELLAEDAALLQETRRVLSWPQVDKRGFFWLAEVRSWEGLERIGLWIDEKVVVFESFTCEGEATGSAPITMFNVDLVSKGGKIRTHKMLRFLKVRLRFIHEECMKKLSAI